MIKLMCETCHELYDSYVLPCYGEPMTCNKCRKEYQKKLKKRQEESKRLSKSKV